MVAQPIPGVFEVIHFHPNKENPEETKKKFATALEYVKKAPGFKAITVEGLSHEDPTLGMRMIEWESYDAHMKGFREGPTFKEFDEGRQGSTVGVSDMKHYKFYGPLPIDPMPEAVERVIISLKPDIDFQDFLAEWMPALAPVMESKGCGPGGIVIGQQMEDPTKAFQFQKWMTLHDHVVTFKQRADLKEIMAPLTAIVEKYVEGGWKGMSAFHLMTCPPGMAV